MKSKMLYIISRCGLFAAIICVCAFINFPVGNVPVSMATLGIMLTGVVLSPVEAVFASFVYILIGMIGVPVFSLGSAGLGTLFGATGGYIWSYPVLCLSVSLFSKIPIENKHIRFFVTFCGSMVGNAVCYFCGTIQYMAVCDASFISAVTVCVLPFVIIDAVKAFVASGMGLAIRQRIKNL